MFAFTRIRVSAQELFAQFSLALFLAAFLALLCMTPLSAQNPATTVSVDASKNQHPINPNIYGFGMFMDSNDVVQTSQLASMNAPVHRFGGDLNSTYNWQQDAWNLSADWYWESYVLSSPFAEGGFADAFISATEAANSRRPSRFRCFPISPKSAPAPRRERHRSGLSR